MMEASNLDLVVVIALCFMAFSTLVFLIFFVPVLIQLAKTLESVRALIETLRDYSKGLGFGFNSAGENLSKLGASLGSILSGLGAVLEAGIVKFFKSRK